ncbi:MAG: hypothetical protein V2I57_02155 [Xanthomonadales bacterium]|jgi:hypothetical protein|nr:hypothetical protein [Xanthomonadales bacterium]
MILRKALMASHAEAERTRTPDFPARELAVLQGFQRDRLAATYADLAAQPRYADACRFFLDELYGGRNAEERDRQVEAALPIIQRTLPRRMQVALADAFRLQAISMAGDIALAEAMAETGIAALNPAAYAALYPRVPREAREEQIALIHQLAMELDRVVHLPLVLGLLIAMRGPARSAGFHALQQFLERGLRAFRTMRGAETFAATIREREQAIMERLYAGDPDPFRPGSRSVPADSG